jgi:hypothetical protein
VPRGSAAIVAAAGVVVVGLAVIGYGALRHPAATPAEADPASATAALTTPPASPSLASPSPSRSPFRAVDTVPASFPHRGPGTFRFAASTGRVLGSTGTLHRFRVAVESNVTQVDLEQLAAKIDAVLGDPRSWIASGTVRFQRVPAGDDIDYDFTIHLATHDTAGRMCRAGGIGTATGYTSCRVPGKVILSLDRWFQSVPYYTDAHVALDTYRTYAVNHEVGHELGHGHQLCPSAGRPAPVMQQQTLGLHGCTANPWPYLNGTLYSGPPGRY